MKSALIRVAIGCTGGVFVYFLGGGRGPAFLAGVILGLAFRRWDAIDAKYDSIETTRHPSERTSSPSETPD
jgi:hypothetical protein